MADETRDETPHLQPIPYATPVIGVDDEKARRLASNACTFSVAGIVAAILILFVEDSKFADRIVPILGACVFCLPILAICFGFAARRRLGRLRCGTHNFATATIGVSIGELLVVFALSLIPSIGRPRSMAYRVKSASNLRQIGQGLSLYGDEYGVYPPDFETLLIHEDLTPNVFINSAGNDTPATGPTTRAAAQILTAQPGHCSYVYTAPNAATQPADPKRIDAYERPIDPAGANFLFGDAHVEFINNPECQRLIAELKAGHNPPRPANAPNATRASISPK